MIVLGTRFNQIVTQKDESRRIDYNVQSKKFQSEIALIIGSPFSKLILNKFILVLTSVTLVVLVYLQSVYLFKNKNFSVFFCQLLYTDGGAIQVLGRRKIG